MERIASEEAILVENLETNERGTKGSRCNDIELIKQVSTGADLLIKSPTQEKSSLRETTQGAPHGRPRPRKTSLQVRTSADLLTNQSQEVTGRLGEEGSHNQYPKVAEDPLSEPSQEPSQRMPRTKTILLQVGTGADLLTKQSCGVTGTPGQHKKNNRPQDKIYISEITQKEFCKAYKNGETTGVVKFSQNEKQIYLGRINISTELAIRDKAEQRTNTRITEDSFESLVVKEYHDLLSAFEKGEKTSLPPHRSGIDLEINMEEGKGLPDQKIYLLGAEELEIAQEYIRKNQPRGWIREAFTDGGSPIMFVKKKDGSLRLSMNYRALNEVTKNDRYPLPLIAEALDRLHTAKYFTKLDIKEAYHNGRMKKGDEWRTTFTSKYGLYESLVMPFGLCNTPATIQRWINRTLQRFIDRCCIIYLDDVLIY